MSPPPSRRAVLGSLATAVGGALTGCSRLEFNPTDTPDRDDQRVEYVAVDNRTEQSRTASVTIRRNGEIVHETTLELAPIERNGENVRVQGLEVLHGPYLEPIGDYGVDVEVADKSVHEDVYRSGATDEECYAVEAQIRPASDGQRRFALAVESHAREGLCGQFEGRATPRRGR